MQQNDFSAPTNVGSSGSPVDPQDWLLKRQQEIAAKVQSSPPLSVDSASSGGHGNQQTTNTPSDSIHVNQPSIHAPSTAAGGDPDDDKNVPSPPTQEDRLLEGFDPKDKNLISESTDDNLQPQATNIQQDDFQIRENPSDNNSVDPIQDVKDNISVDPLQIRVNPNDIQNNQSPNSSSSQNMVNPKGTEELTRADIFKLLGMGGIDEAEKKKNLDEMEETIWMDFIETDLPEMLVGDEKDRYLDFLKTSPSSEKIINFFGKNLPINFETKYLEKTLKFKEEIVKEQIETLLLASEGKDEKKINLLQSAKSAAYSGRWKEVETHMSQYK